MSTHNAGRGAAYTRSRLPVELVWWRRAKDRSDALRREAAIKRLTRLQKLELAAARARRRAGARVVTGRRSARPG